MVAMAVVRRRADGAHIAEPGMAKTFTPAEFETYLRGNEGGRVMSDHLVSLDQPVEHYGGVEQRTALLNVVNRARTSEEAAGLITAHNLMRRHIPGAKLMNVSLHYSGNQGLDMIYELPDGQLSILTYAAVEAKSGHSRNRNQLLGKDQFGVRQGSALYNYERVKKYRRHNGEIHQALAARLEYLAQANKLKSFATFAKDESLWELRPRDDGKSTTDYQTSLDSGFDAVKLQQP